MLHYELSKKMRAVKLNELVVWEQRWTKESSGMKGKVKKTVVRAAMLLVHRL